MHRRPCLLHRAEAVQLLVQGTEPQKRRVCGKHPEGRFLINGDFMGDFSWVRPKDGSARFAHKDSYVFGLGSLGGYNYDINQ